MKKINKQNLKIGVISGCIASLCCIGPLVIIIFGLGTASTALAVGAQKPYFILVGVIFFVISISLTIKKQKKKICEGTTTKQQERRRIINFILIALITLILIYIFLIHIIAPFITPTIYNLFY